ncbi:MAG: hypothetical protein IKA79_01145, partial [Lentisphaeria bacterium]|nr:hypothetical protein [Lentisphaeria bacterium]
SAPPVLIAEEIILLDQALMKNALELIVHINDTAEERGKLERIRELVQQHPGETKLVLCVHTGDHSVFIESKGIYSVSVTQCLVQSINELFNNEFRCRFKANLEVPRPKVRYVPKQEESQEKEENE